MVANIFDRVDPLTVNLVGSGKAVHRGYLCKDRLGIAAALSEHGNGYATLTYYVLTAFKYLGTVGTYINGLVPARVFAIVPTEVVSFFLNHGILNTIPIIGSVTASLSLLQYIATTAKITHFLRTTHTLGDVRGLDRSTLSHVLPAWLCQDIEKQGGVKNLNDTKIVKVIRDYAFKKAVVSFIAMLGSLCALLGVIGVLVGCPPLGAILWLGLGFTILKFVVNGGVAENNLGGFSAMKCLPAPVQYYFSKEREEKLRTFTPALVTDPDFERRGRRLHLA